MQVDEILKIMNCAISGLRVYKNYTY